MRETLKESMQTLFYHLNHSVLQVTVKACGILVLICIHDADHFIPGVLFRKPYKWTYNYIANNRIVNKTSEDINSFSKLMTIFKNSQQEKYSEPCKVFVFRLCFENALLWSMLTHFEQFFFKVCWLCPKFNKLCKKN